MCHINSVHHEHIIVLAAAFATGFVLLAHNSVTGPYAFDYVGHRHVVRSAAILKQSIKGLQGLIKLELTNRLCVPISLINKQHGVLHELGLRQLLVCPEVAGFYSLHTLGQPGQEKVPAPSAVQKLLQPSRITQDIRVHIFGHF